MLHASSPWQKLNSSREFIEGCKLMLENLAWKCLVWKLTFLQYCYSLYLSSQRGEGKAHASQYLDFCFQRIGFLSLSSSSLNPLPNEPLLLVGICCVFQVCGGEQRLRILVLCWYFLSQIFTPCNLPLLLSFLQRNTNCGEETTYIPKSKIYCIV